MQEMIDNEAPLHQCACCGDMCDREDLGTVTLMDGKATNILACSQACHDDIAAEQYGLTTQEVNDIKRDNPPTEPTSDELPF